MSQQKKTVRLRALGRLYHDRALRKGDEFDATEEEAADLCQGGLGGLQLAERMPEAVKPERYRRRDLTAQEE